MIHAETSMNLKERQSKRSQLLKVTYCTRALAWQSFFTKIRVIEDRSVVSRG